MTIGPRTVTLVSPENATLGHALSAALASRGWTVRWRRLHERRDHGLQDVIVLVEDDQGNWSRQVPTTTVRQLVGIGSVRSLPALLDLRRRGAVVLNQSAPILALLRHVEAVMARSTTAGTASTWTLRRRADEHRSLSLLTVAEDAVLRGLLAGAGASSRPTRTATRPTADGRFPTSPGRMPGSRRVRRRTTSASARSVRATARRSATSSAGSG